MTLIGLNRSIWIKSCPIDTSPTTDLAWNETPPSAVDLQRLTACASHSEVIAYTKNSSRFKRIIEGIWSPDVIAP
jgi:hypothetical protein